MCDNPECKQKLQQAEAGAAAMREFIQNERNSSLYTLPECIEVHSSETKKRMAWLDSLLASSSGASFLARYRAMEEIIKELIPHTEHEYTCMANMAASGTECS